MIGIITMMALVVTLAIILIGSYTEACAETASPIVFKTPKGKEDFMSAYDDFLADWPIPYEARYVATRFGATHVLMSGPENAPPLILLHAFGTSSTIWIRMIADLSMKYRTYLVDIIGDANKSEYTCALTSIEDGCTWLADVYAGLGVDTAYLGGLSYGGWLSTGFAIAAPERVRGLVLLAPAASLVPLRLSFYLHFLLPLLSPRLTTVNATLRWLSTKRRIEEPRLANQMLMALKHFKHSKGTYPKVFSDADLCQITVPTLLLIGDHEVIYNPVRALARAKRLIPNLEATLVPETSHLLVLEKPDVVNRHILEFLGRVEATLVEATVKG